METHMILLLWLFLYAKTEVKDERLMKDVFCAIVVFYLGG